jgi:hypothetical protein
VAFLRIAFINAAVTHPSVYLEPGCQWDNATRTAVRKHLSDAAPGLVDSLKAVQFGVSIQSLDPAPIIVLSSDDMRTLGQNCQAASFPET